MSQITPSKVFLNDIPVEFLNPFSIVFSRGFTPSSFKVYDTDNRFNNLKNPVTIRIECASQLSTDKDVIELKNWFVLGKKTVEGSWGVVYYEIADIRRALMNGALTQSYNIRSYGGEFRDESLDDGERWTAAKAMKDALERLIEQVGIDSKVIIAKDVDQSTSLPQNLGNSRGGGWFGAKLPEFGPSMLEAIRADIVPHYDGNIRIVGRQKKTVAKVHNWNHIGGIVDTRDNRWVKPKSVDVIFQRRIERRFEKTITQPTGKTAVRTSETPPGELVIENVIPDIDVDNPTEFGDLIPMSEFLKKIKLPEKLVAENFTKPTLFPRIEGFRGYTAQQITINGIAEQRIRAFWRKLWRVVNDETDPYEARRLFANIEIGRLQKDGTTKAGGISVNYVEMLRFGILPSPDAHTLDQVFSKHYALDPPVALKQNNAPFITRWIDESELVFLIEDDIKNVFNVKHQYIGTFEHDISFGNVEEGNVIDKIIDGEPIIFEANTKLTQDLDLAVYWNGLLVDNHIQLEERLYTVNLPMFSDGETEKIVTRSDDITANYQFDVNNRDWPGILLNEADLQERAEFLRDQIKKSYMQKRSGILEHLGIAPITRGQFRVEGDMYQIIITVGAGQPYEIHTNVVIQPELIPARTKPKQGENPKEIII